MKNIEPFILIDELSKHLGNRLPKANQHLKIVITIPAKNEERSIERTLLAIRNQLQSNSVFFDFKFFEVLVLCNHCSDNTEKICKLFKYNDPHFPLHILSTKASLVNNVGVARRILMNIASERLPIANGIIVSTDADTVPDNFWLHNFVQYISTDIALICGRIEVDEADLHPKAKKYLSANRKYLYLASQLESSLYPDPADPWPKHAHNSGPNLAIKKYAYQKIGGIPPLGFLEDIAMYQLVVGHGLKVRHCLKSAVVTSTRTTPRVPGGFGNQLREWSELNGSVYEYMVEGIDKLRVKFETYELIKELYKTGSTSLLLEISKRLLIPLEQVKELYSTHERQQAMVRFLETDLMNNVLWNSKYPDEDVFQVIHDLEAYLNPVPQANY